MTADGRTSVAIAICTYKRNDLLARLLEALLVCAERVRSRAAIGVVLVDDTNWPHVRQANLDFIKHSPYEYQMLLDVQTPRTGHPTFWNGIMLFERGKRKTAAGTTHRPRRAAA